MATQDANGFLLTDKSRALLRSQGGPLAGLPFSCCPSSLHTARLRSTRVLHLRCSGCSSSVAFGFPFLSPSASAGVAVCLLDSFGHHRAACANVGVLGRRGFALESAAASACREAGVRVQRDLDIAAPNATDNRRFPTGVPHARCADIDGAATMAARRRKQRRYLKLAGEDGRARPRGPCV